jgi:cell division protein FtsB
MYKYGRKKPVSKPGRKLIVYVVAAVLVFSFGKGLVKISQLLYRKHVEQHELNTVRDEKQQLETEVDRLTSDSTYIEEIARKEYGMIRDGEEVYRMALPDSTK